MSWIEFDFPHIDCADEIASVTDSKVAFDFFYINIITQENSIFAWVIVNLIVEVSPVKQIGCVLVSNDKSKRIIPKATVDYIQPLVPINSIVLITAVRKFKPIHFTKNKSALILR